MPSISKIAILGSGSGSNAQAIIDYFKGSPGIKIAFIASDQKDALILNRASIENIKTVLIPKENLNDPDFFLRLMRDHQVKLLILAGYLRLISPEFLKAFSGMVINIHPALLPDYGGKGMYGMNVHNAIIQNGEKESGITIHEVNEDYDKGAILFQKNLTIEPGWDAKILAEKVQKLEHYWYPRIIENLCKKNLISPD